MLATSESKIGTAITTGSNTFTFPESERPTLSEGTTYWFFLRYSGGSATNYVVVDRNSNTNDYALGACRIYYSGTWEHTINYDLTGGFEFSAATLTSGITHYWKLGSNADDSVGSLYGS